MKYLADSNIISEPTKPTPNNKVLTLLNKKHRKISISVITYFELFYGILLLQDGKRKQALQSYLENNVLPYYEILDYDKLTAEYNAQIISTLRKRGIQIPILDSQIAATALAHNLILITRNSKDFVQIQDFFPLKIENWF